MTDSITIPLEPLAMTDEDWAKTARLAAASLEAAMRALEARGYDVDLAMTPYGVSRKETRPLEVYISKRITI